MKASFRIKSYIKYFFCCFVFWNLAVNSGVSAEKSYVVPSNFGLPGIIDLPSAKRLADGELVFTQQIHKYQARSGVSFQALPRLGVAFRYTGHGKGGREAHGRINHDRSFDVHLSIVDEGTYWPAFSIGLRDFIGTGWYSSEYLVGTKTFGNLEVSAGLGFGRLKGRNSYPNPMRIISPKFEERSRNDHGLGGTFGTLNWFQGETSNFYGINYRLGDRLTFSSEYNPDLMKNESNYLSIESPWNFGLMYRFNDYVSLSTQYLYGSQVSLSGHIALNPGRPPVKGGKELAPVPMRFREQGTQTLKVSNKQTIRNVLAADKFIIHRLKIDDDSIRVDLTNTKFRSNAQAVGRVSSTLQRFTSDNIEKAYISFHNLGIQVATYRVDLNEITQNQFTLSPSYENQSAIIPIDIPASSFFANQNRFSWGIGPYFGHRLFNPDLPLSAEAGIELSGGFNFTPGLKFVGAVRKSVLTNLTDNERRSNSVLPRVHSDWPLYDFAGQKGHIHEMKLSYLKNVTPSIYGRLHAGLLEPFYAGIGGELLYKPIKSPFAVGLDLHMVRKRNYDMLFDLLDYKRTLGHISFYYDVGGMFDIELNAGRYLAGDVGITTNISRRFGSGWEVGGYATLTDVPFDTFGEGSFDKAIYISIPIDWIVSTPNRARRKLTLRPITRDGGANMASARSLYRFVEESHSSHFKREYGRLWK